MELINKTLKYKGTETTVYFRELTAGEQLELAKGQQIKGSKDGAFELDLGVQTAKGQQLVYMTLVDAEGKRVYRSIDDLRKESNKKVQALAKLAQEAANEVDDGDPGNV